MTPSGPSDSDDVRRAFDRELGDVAGVSFGEGTIHVDVVEVLRERGIENPSREQLDQAAAAIQRAAAGMGLESEVIEP